MVAVANKRSPNEVEVTKTREQRSVDACREQGLKIGFDYSLMDWYHPAGARCAYDPAARRRFLDIAHGCVRELMKTKE